MDTNNLHSTMYLLNQEMRREFKVNDTNLHSTMYLLNHLCPGMDNHHYLVFTFHYVSIKSGTAIPKVLFYCHLHSTMYLLNLSL